MAAAAAQQLCLKVQSPRSLISISKQLYSGLHQQPARLRHRPSTFLAIRLPTQISLFNRPFISSPPSASLHKQLTSIGMEWYELSIERQIQWLLSSGLDTKWGWVIYRCTYEPELQSHWESFKRLVNEKTGKTIAESDAPDIAEKLDWVFVEDPELESASLDELKRRFRAWVRAEVQNSNYDIDTIPSGRGSRHTYFIQVDKGALRSLLRDPTNPDSGVDLNRGYVNIVRGWQDPLPPEEATDEFGEAVDNEDRMKIQASMIAPHFYVDLGNDESWYAHYSPPPHCVCVW